MLGDLKIRKTKTASGATAIQLIRYAQGKRMVVQPIGSAHTDIEIEMLYNKAEEIRESLCTQPSLFSEQNRSSQLIHKDQLQLTTVTHQFAYEALINCSQQCGLSGLNQLYQDLALMRIIEPTSKLRTIELLKRYFNITHAKRTVYRLLPKILDDQEVIERAAYQTASIHFRESFSLIFYDVTTLYFETQKPDDELLAKGFSKEDKSKQPQIVLGLLVTPQGFPLMHEVYKGNTFEGHTMLSIIKAFQKRYTEARFIIVADAAMLSKNNMQALEIAGYQYIVGARLANTTPRFLDLLTKDLPRNEGAIIRLPYPGRSYEIICTYSEKRYKKDKHTFEQQIEKAKTLVLRKEPGKRAKFVKKALDAKNPYQLDEFLKNKTEKLLGIKGYCTNVPSDQLSNEQVVDYYHQLWHVEQAFRMSKTDLKTRPIFHYKQDAVKAHVLICFMALMMGKFLEIKTGLSLRRVRDILWNVHEAHLFDSLTGKKFILQTNLDEYYESGLFEVLKPH